jgi:nitrogenase iron protein NifH
MEKIAVYGKGGIGKSVIATSLSAHFALSGRSVLHVGCDPKQDSAFRLTNGARIPSVLDVLARSPQMTSASSVLHPGRHKIICCESGGPEPGLGCGGRGVARTLEFLGEMEVLETGNYDVVMFDVLGDVVCGGFAAPLRQGFAQKVVIVLSEEPMALFAANNIAKAINTYRRNGVCLAGFVANLRSADGDAALLERFAEELSTRLLATIPRDPEIIAAEKVRQTVVEFAPESAASRQLAKLALGIEALDPATQPLPTPLSEEAFFEFIKDGP